MSRSRWPVLVACTLAATTAAAQRGPAAPRGPTTQRTPTPAGTRTTPDSDKLEAAADNIARMRAAMKQVLGRAEQARDEKDVVKLNCVNEKLTQMRALIKVAEQADIALRESVTFGSSAGEAEFSKIAIARTKVDGLRSQSEQCIGQLAYVVEDKTTVEVETPADLPGRDALASLGVAVRGENPADLGRDIRAGSAATAGELPPAPPAIIRQPAASPFE